ncbi:MAG: tetratricopeptide repeat protein, partial [Bacteroidia bacterium]|nr:tetratricopeptide repeat protein [Bacteroidia bacterium]
MYSIKKINKFHLSILISLIFAISVPLYAQNKKMDSLLLLLRTAKEDTNKVAVFSELAMEISRSNPDSALRFAIKGLELATKLNRKEAMAAADNNLGIFSRRLGNYDASIHYYLDALDLYDKLEKETDGKTKIKIQAKKFKSMGNLGFVYAEKSNYPMALNYFFKVLKNAEETGNKKAIARNLTNIAGVYFKTNNNAKTAEYYGRALKMFEEIDDKGSVATVLSNFAGFYESRGDHTKALDYCFKALKIFEEIDDKNNWAMTLGNIGNIYRQQKEVATAFAYYQKALKIKEETDDKGGIAILMGNMGELYLSDGKFKEAEFYLKRSLALDEATGSLEGQVLRTNYLNALYEKTGQHKLAFEYFKKYIGLRDSITNEANTKKQTMLEMQYEFDKKSAADSIRNTEAKRFEEIKHLQEISRQKTFTYGGLA